MLILIRESDGFGKLYLNGEFICHTLENPSTLIPNGIHKIENSQSPKFKRELPLIHSDSIPPSRGIRIHSGNTIKDTIGCVLVGMGRNGNSLTESKLAETMVTMICRNSKSILIV